MSEPLPNANSVLRLSHVGRTFEQAGRQLRVLTDVNLVLGRGEITALVGQSGSGKSTLLHLAGLLEPPTSGEVFIEGSSSSEMSDADRTKLRRSHIGFVYQFHHLLPEFSALENVALPQMIAGQSRATAQQRAQELLEQLQLGDRLDHRPARLSGGEQQRVAIARALANEPKLLLADEPTGNLDPETADRVLDQLLALARERHVSALIATHNAELAGRMDRTLRLKDGKLVDQTEKPEPVSAPLRAQ